MQDTPRVHDVVAAESGGVGGVQDRAGLHRPLRITGGEPLTRRNVLQLFRLLEPMTALRDIGVSTNGSLLGREVIPGGATIAQELRRLRVNSVNISLDSLDPVTFRQITGRDYLSQTLAGIAAAKEAGI